MWMQWAIHQQPLRNITLCPVQCQPPWTSQSQDLPWKQNVTEYIRALTFSSCPLGNLARSTWLPGWPTVLPPHSYPRLGGSHVPNTEIAFSSLFLSYEQRTERQDHQVSVTAPGSFGWSHFQVRQVLMHMTRPVERSLPRRGEKGTDGWSSS